jgi:hypothetical protein
MPDVCHQHCTVDGWLAIVKQLSTAGAPTTTLSPGMRPVERYEMDKLGARQLRSPLLRQL